MYKGSPGEKGFIRGRAIKIVAKKKANMGTNPEIDPDYPAGTNDAPTLKRQMGKSVI